MARSRAKSNGRSARSASVDVLECLVQCGVAASVQSGEHA